MTALKTNGSVKRRTRIGIVTNKMSDEVYSVLVKKGENNELTKYIVGLVENDIKQEQLQIQLAQIQNHLENFNDIIMELEKKLDNRVM